MFDSPTERILTYRLSAAYDCWGRRRNLRCGTRGGVWFLDRGEIDEPQPNQLHIDNNARCQQLAVIVASGRFTATEIATLHALVIDRLSIDEIAQRDGCSPQAVKARLTGNSRGQGGILKKARTLLSQPPLRE